MTYQIAFGKQKIPEVIRYCLYARKSMEAEERQALSIDSQIAEMKAIADRDGLQIVCFKSEAHSAKSSGQRAVFNELIQEIKEGKYNGIITWNPDRLSRNAGDLGQVIDLMDKEFLLEIRTYGQSFRNTPNDKFLLMILGSQAKLENDNRSINVQRGMRTRVEAGLWPSSAPTGYLNSNLRDHLCEKIVDPIRGPIVRQMFEKVAYEGWTNRQLCLWLRDINFRTIKGKHMGMSSIYEILHRTFYYGEFEYPRGSGKWYKGKHKRLITKKLFNQAQEVLKDHASTNNYKRLDSNPFLFSKFLRCGLCGSGFTGQEKIKKHRRDNKTTRYLYYNCTQAKDPHCRNCFISEKDLINEFLNLLDVVPIEMIGMRNEIDEDIERAYGYKSYVDKEPVPERDEKQKELDVRKYAKVLFEGDDEERKLKIIEKLRGKVLVGKNRKLYFEK